MVVAELSLFAMECLLVIHCSLSMQTVEPDLHLQALQLMAHRSQFRLGTDSHYQGMTSTDGIQQRMERGRLIRLVHPSL
jgi:hypothetical protein